MLPLRKRIHDKISNGVLWIDYILYGMCNFYKYKIPPPGIGKIIVIETRNIGDILVITPVLRALRERYPDAQIDVLVKEQFKSVLYGNTQIDNVIGWNGNDTHLKTLLNPNTYDLGVLLHVGSWKVSNALRKTNVQYRIGCAKERICTGKGFFLHKKIKPNTKWQHKIEDNLDVVRSMGVDTKNKDLEIHTTAEAEQRINKELLKNKVLQNKFIVCMHAVSQHVTQRWYQERFAEVADKLIKDNEAKIVFTGRTEDTAYIDEILKKMKYNEDAINLAGKTSFHELVGVIKAANVVISIDTSVIHIASALNKPLVALFGPTIPTFWGPKNTRSITLWKQEVCTGCRNASCMIKTNECMKHITTQDVLQAVEQVRKRK